MTWTLNQLKRCFDERGTYNSKDCCGSLISLSTKETVRCYIIHVAPKDADIGRSRIVYCLILAFQSHRHRIIIIFTTAVLCYLTSQISRSQLNDQFSITCHLMRLRSLMKLKQTHQYNNSKVYNAKGLTAICLPPASSSC